MPDNFDWRSEDESLWKEQPVDDQHQAEPHKKRRWPFILAALLLALVAGAFVTRQILLRAEQNTDARRADVIISHNLIRQADAERDSELFDSLLSGRNKDWTDAQRSLFRNGLITGRSHLGLERLAVETLEPPEPEITFSPDLSSAELVESLPYAVDVGNGLSETITLRHTATYRLGQDKWLLSPPEAGFWELSDSQSLRRMTINYPQRDRELAARLATDLDGKIDEFCQTAVDFRCPDDLAVFIRLSTDPHTLAENRVTDAATNSRIQVILPAPTLVGIPEDEAGYQALFRGYASLVLSAVIDQLSGYECCQGLPLFQALVDWQLAQLSLRAWPVTPQDYVRLLEERLQFTDIAGYWNESDRQFIRGSHGWSVYVAVDYLLKTYPTLETAEMMRQMSGQRSLYQWLNGLLPDTDGLISVELNRGWWVEAYPQLQVADAKITDVWPNQTLHLLCSVGGQQDPVGQETALVRYDPVEDDWTTVYQTRDYIYMNPLPSDDGIVVQELNFDNQSWRPSIWRQGQLSPLIGGAEAFAISFGQSDPGGEKLLAFVFPPGSDEADLQLLDLTDCSNQSCAAQDVPGLPIWSADGSQAIFTDNADLQLGLLTMNQRVILYDAAAITEPLEIFSAPAEEIIGLEEIDQLTNPIHVGRGHAPFWLDEDTIGFMALGNGRFARPSQEIIAFSLSNGETQHLVSTDELLDAFPNNASVERLFWIHYAMTHPSDQSLLFVAAFDAWDKQAYIFSYDRDSGQVKHLVDLGYAANHSLGISPDGRYLVLTGLDPDSPGGDDPLMLVYDLETEQTAPLPTISADLPSFLTYDWSVAGDLLALMLTDNEVGLYVSDEKALHILETPSGRCSTPIWLNAE